MNHQKQNPERQGDAAPGSISPRISGGRRRLVYKAADENMQARHPARRTIAGVNAMGSKCMRSGTATAPLLNGEHGPLATKRKNKKQFQVLIKMISQANKNSIKKNNIQIIILAIAADARPLRRRETSRRSDDVRFWKSRGSKMTDRRNAD